MTESELKIAHFIKHFLFSHEVLCLNGVGRFECTPSEFSVDPVSKVITPSLKKVNFSQGDFETTEAFVDFLKLNVDIPQLEDALSTFGLSLRASILTGKRFEIEGLGYFKFNVLGELDFEPQREVSFDKATFGLVPIHFAANLLKVKRLEVSAVEEEDVALTQMRESALKELKVMLDQAKITESTSEVKSSKLFPVIATVLTLVLLVNLGLFLYSGPIDNLKNQVAKMDIFGKTGEVIEKSVKESIQLRPTVVQSPALVNKSIDYSSLTINVASAIKRDSFYFDSLDYLQPFNLVQTETLLEDTLTIAAALPTPTVEEVFVVEEEEIELVKVEAISNDIPEGFYIVAGAFKSEDNAASLVINLRKSGHKDAITLKPKTYPLHMAAFARKKSMSQAKRLAEKLKADGKSVWIYAAY